MARAHRTPVALLAVSLLLVPVGMRWSLWGFDWSGLLSDLFIGCALLLLLHNRPRWLVAPLLVCWAVLQSSALELVEAVSRLPELADIEYLLNPDFVSQSATPASLAHPVYAALLLIPALALLAFRRPHDTPSPALHSVLWLCPLALFGLHAIAMQHEDSDAPWKQYNALHKLAAEKVVRTLRSRTDREAALWAAAEKATLEKPDLSGKPLLPLPGKARNVLIVAMEGIPGAYIDQIREARGYAWDQQPMPLLSAYAKEQHAMHTADYVVHAHQTIRGLYSLLCGDYPKLDSSTPKAIEMLASSNQNTTCLPAQLAQHGIATHFLQGADLAFMSKDKVMPKMGFQTTCGHQCLKSIGKLTFTWGADDKQLFTGAADYIRTLRKGKDPWMLTILTVGTHQPYAAPESYIKKYGDAKMASVAMLDEAITQFMQSLQKQGVLEDTLVILTSDESHGNDDLRLASAWGLSLIFTPERQQLPDFKSGVYGHIDVATTVLDYLGLPVEGVMGRSQFRQYNSGRDMVSYTNGYIRLLSRDGRFHECQFQSGCRDTPQNGFIVSVAHTEPAAEPVAGRVEALASLLNQSQSLAADRQDYLFAEQDKRKLKAKPENDWTDNLIGAQYLEFASGTRTEVTLRVKALKTDKKGARLWLRLKEFDQDSSILPPELPVLQKGENFEVTFSIDNPAGRRAFSFHLLGSGKGEISIEEFRVSVVNPGEANTATSTPEPAQEVESPVELAPEATPPLQSSFLTDCRGVAGAV